MSLAMEAVRGSGVTDTRPVAVYSRISKRKSGDGRGAYLGRERQLEDGRDYVARELVGADVVEFWDNMSAWDPEVVRPDWEDMLARLEAGEFRAVVAWHADRYTRQPLQLELLFRAAKAGRAEVHTVVTGKVETPTLLRIQGAIAADESDQKSRRITRKLAQSAAAGTPHGGRRRWGYEPGMVAVRESEAAIIRDVVERLLAGESLHSLAKWLRANGVATTSGGTWTGPNLRNMLRRPHLAGLRVHHGEVVGEGAWEPILSPATHARVVAHLAAPERRTSPGNARKYLLTGLAKCGTCGAPLRARPRTGRGQVAAYYCTTTRHVHRSMETVDAEVGAFIVARLSRLDAAGVFVADDSDDLARVRAELVALRGRWDEAVAEHAAGRLSARAMAATTTALEAQIDQAEAAERTLAMEVARPSTVLNGVTGPGAAEVWERLPLDRRRAIITVLAEVTLTGGRRGWRPEDVTVEWR